MGEGKAALSTDETTVAAVALLVCPQCPNRPPVRDLARHNARYHKEKKTRGTVRFPQLTCETICIVFSFRYRYSGTVPVFRTVQ
jgi:hypothetical protein